MSPPLLLERDGEIAALDAAVGAVAAGEARVRLLEGPAGIGKTRLLAEARHRAESAGLRPLVARSSASERAFPFGVVRQLFEPALVNRDARKVALTGAAAAARDVFDIVAEPDDDQPAGDPSFASLHGLYWLTVNITADGPLAVLVDDLHWCDAASLRFLAYLVRRLDGLPVLVAATLRPAERAADAAVLGELISDASTVSVRPRPLSEPATAELLGRRLAGNVGGRVGEVDAAFTAACHTATGGNPLLLHELVRALDAEGVRPDAAHVAMVAHRGPRFAGRSVLVRLARLPEAAVRMARAAAVLGDGVDLSLVAELAGLDEDRLVAAADALVRAEILRDEPAVGFVHPLVRDAVYADVTPVARAQAHQRAAHLLADRGAPAEQVAAHLLAVPPHGDAWVVETVATAARTASRRGAAESAVEYLRRALAEPPPAPLRTEVLLELGRAELLTCGPAAVEHLWEGYAALAELDRRAAVAQLLGRGLLFTGEPDAAVDLARHAAAELPPGHDDTRAGLAALEFWAVFFGADDPATLRGLEAHRALPVPGGLGSKMLAVVAAQEWAYGGGPSDVCAELSRQALAGGVLLAKDLELSGVAALVTLALADDPAALDGMDAALADAHRRGSLVAKLAVALFRGFVLMRFGDLADAERSIRSLDEFAQWGYSDVAGNVHGAAFLSTILRERGDLVGARRALERFRDPGDGSEAARYWCHARLELLIGESRHADALAVADDATARFAYLRHPIDTPWRSSKAMALDGLGRREEALALLADELALARAWGAPGTVARTLRVRGTLRRDRGLDDLREAVEAAAGSPARLEHAKALVALGAGLRRGGHVREAREPLRRAAELAAACSASGLTEQARTELYLAGSRPRTRTLTGPGSLTMSERRVVELAVRGATNRDVAQALFITPKTVELHLSNAYRKLGISSRRRLGDALATT